MLINIRKVQETKPITFFLICTFVITWTSWIIIIIGNNFFNTLLYGEPIFWIIYTVGSLGPAISALLVYKKCRESFAEKTFTKYIFGSKISARIWLIFILFLAWRFFMIWFAFGIHKPISILSFVVNLPFLITLGGAEEMGWRGILQPKIEKIVFYLPSVLLVATIWSLWHLPLWFIKGTVQSGFPFWLYAISGLVLTASFTTLYKYSNNLFLCILSHAWFNYCIGLALYLGRDGVLQLDMNWKVVLVFSIEIVIAVGLGFVYNRKNKKI